jgi:phospholipase/lecithinase/hemolysin
MFTIPHARRRTRWPLIGLLIAALAVPGWAADAAPEVVVFGTSLSDPGNAFALRGGTNAPPSYDVDPLFVPTSPYAYGGHHFTNGSTWIEQLGLILGFAEDVQPALASEGVMAANFAVGSARAWEDGINVNLADQVDAYLQRTGGVADPDALYVIEMGGGDLRDAVAVLAGGGSPGPVLTDALLSIAQQTGLLYSRGARRFLVWNAPDISLTPAIRRLDAQVPGAAFAAAALTVLFNQGLDLVIGELGTASDSDRDL